MDKLTPAQRAEAVERYRTGETLSSMARRFNCSPSDVATAIRDGWAALSKGEGET